MQFPKSLPKPLQSSFFDPHLKADNSSLQSSRAEGVAEPVLLIIADISGYTRYMTANAKTLSHSHTIIAELIEAIASAIDLPMEIAELEGDAIFLFCRKNRDPALWNTQRELVCIRLMEFFHRFKGRLQELRRSNVCTCHACAHIDQLNLKVLVHSGEVLVHRVLQFNKLSGVDVILIHRLLKNSVGRPEYLLLTDAAHRDLEFPQNTRFEAGSEEYEHLGRITTFVHFLQPETVAGAAPKRSFLARHREGFRTFLKLWFGQLSGARKTRDGIAPQVNPLAKLALSLVTLLLTPVMIPAGAIVTVIHACKSGERGVVDISNNH